jgi:16S rRNA (cytosine1402-N4)-methyltransferase
MTSHATQNSAPHISVLRTEAVDALAVHDGGVYVDGTFGRGGYTRAILATPGARVVAIDRDPDAIDAGRDMVSEFSPRLALLQGPFGAMDVMLAGQQIREVDGVALDLGVSSPQFDDASRGFSFSHDGPLDMRMSKAGPSAADIVNEMEETELANLLYTLGEERLSRRVARTILEARKSERITRTAQLADIVRRAVPRANDGIDPATRSFQALRIHVNDELGELRRALVAAEQLLKPHGRLAVVSFHSLEDRVVKEFMRDHSGSAPGPSRHMPANDHHVPAPSFEVLTRKPQIPAEAELASNPRARSAKLRVAERTDAPVMKEYVA